MIKILTIKTLKFLLINNRNIKIITPLFILNDCWLFFFKDFIKNFIKILFKRVLRIDLLIFIIIFKYLFLVQIITVVINWIFNGIGAIRISQTRIRIIFGFNSGLNIRAYNSIILFMCLMIKSELMFFSNFLFFLIVFVHSLLFFYGWKINFSNFYFSFNSRVPMIFDTIISSPRNILRYNCPFVSILSMSSY